MPLSCCPSNGPEKQADENGKDSGGSSCHGTGKRDYFYLSIVSLTAFFYCLHLFFHFTSSSHGGHGALGIGAFSHHFFELMNTMSWGIFIGIVAVGVLNVVPRDYIFSIIGRPGQKGSILRAASAGILLDLCNHGILLVGMNLYKRGASLGQVAAFLIASPWNSISLTIVLFTLVGLGWTLAFVFLSFVIAIISGVIFDRCVGSGVLPKNSNLYEEPAVKVSWAEAFNLAKQQGINRRSLKTILVSGFKDSKMIVKWIFLGALISTAIKTYVPEDIFSTYFGPSFMGLMITLAATTVIEVCSEGSSPIAADILNRASAPGNAFTFLMAGVATDYTEILSVKTTTGSWKSAFFIPLITVPQILILGYLLNMLQ